MEEDGESLIILFIIICLLVSLISKELNKKYGISIDDTFDRISIYSFADLIWHADGIPTLFRKHLLCCRITYAHSSTCNSHY